MDSGRSRAAWIRLLRHADRVAIAFALAVSFAGIGSHGLWSPDEPRESGIAYEMLVRGFPALPTLSGEPFLEKPPLFVWLGGLSMRLFGVNETALRLPVALCSALAIWFAFRIGRQCGGRASGLCAAVAMAWFATFWSVGHRAANDVLLLAAVGGAHDALLRARTAVRRGAPDARWYALAGFAAGVAFLTKGVVGPVLVAGPPLLACVFVRDWNALRRMVPRVALAVGLFVVAFGLPWALALATYPGGGQNVYDCVLGQAIGRTLGERGLGAHSKPFWFYAFAGSGGLLPWSAALLAMVASPVMRRRLKQPPLRDAGLCFLAGLLLLSLPSGKRVIYLVPLLPAAAAIPGVWLARLQPSESWGRRCLLVMTGSLALAGLAGALFAGALVLDWRPPGASLAWLTRSSTGLLVASLLAAAALGGVSAWLFRGLRTPGRARAAIRGFPLVAALVLVASHGLGRPLLDPLHDLRAGCHVIAAAILADEPIVAFNASETLRGAMPFYTGRIVERLRPADAQAQLAQLTARGARHLVVIVSSLRLPDALVPHLVEVARTPALGDLDAIVYAVRGDGGEQ